MVPAQPRERSGERVIGRAPVELHDEAGLSERLRELPREQVKVLADLMRDVIDG